MNIAADVVAELAPNGVLRAGLNLSNFLLVSGRASDGTPLGVAPDMASALAERVGVPVQYVTFPNPGALADAASADIWDVGLLGAEPARAKQIEFSPAYVEIQSSYLVPPASPLHQLIDVDRPGIRIASTARTAYGLWLDRNIKHAEIVHAETIDEAFEMFLREKLDVLSGLRPRLIKDQGRLPGSRILDGHFAAVQQAVGVRTGTQSAARFVRTFVAEAITSGLVASLIAKHRIDGLSVAATT